jgi:tyramine---L-glutamate ligase
VKVFVYEYSCAAPEAPAGSLLRAEGWAMLSAFLEDFASLGGVQTMTLVARDVRADLPGVTCRRILNKNERASFIELSHDADATLAIAPEFDDLLAERCQWISQAGGHSLGCTRGAIRLCGDKLLLARHLRARGVRTPPCQSWPESCLRFPFPVVLKPRFGAGSQATFLARDMGELDCRTARAAHEGWGGSMIVQPFLAGKSASVSFFVGPEQAVALAPTSQALTSDGRFHYLGGWLPLKDGLACRAIRLAKSAVAAVAGLRGYVGVDLVLGREVDGGQDWIIEINPRPTTSYVGLRALARTNLAQVLLDVVEGKPVPGPAWRSEPLCFYPDGTIKHGKEAVFSAEAEG